MKKLHLSHSEPCPSPLCVPNIVIQASSQTELGLGSHHAENAALDPNGNLLHLSCSNPDSGKTVCPPLNHSQSETSHGLANRDAKERRGFHSESEATYRAKR